MTINEEIISTNTHLQELYIGMREQLNRIWELNDSIIVRIRQSIEVVSTSLEVLRLTLNDTTFKSAEEEIHFFKHTKPHFYCWLIYLLKLLQMETRRPTENLDTELAYLQKELHRLTYYFHNNLEFYQYYRTGSTHLDEIYFVRSRRNIYFTLDEHYFSFDPTFSTSHDHKIAKILAHEMIRIYLNHAIESLQEKSGMAILQVDGEGGLQWTGSKTSLIELIYALQSVGVFNHSEADIRHVAAYFEKVFRVELGNFYRFFQEIRIRKKTRTQFLDQLTQSLTQKMDETDTNFRY